MNTRVPNNLLEGSLLKSLLTLAVPIVVANMLQSGYQIIDAFWVGRLGGAAVAAVSISFMRLQATVESGAAYGLMLKDHNQTFPFHFDGAADDPVFYAALKAITSGKHVESPSNETLSDLQLFSAT